MTLLVVLILERGVSNSACDMNVNIWCFSLFFTTISYHNLVPLVLCRAASLLPVLKSTYSGEVQGREADHSPPSSTEVKNAWNRTFIPPIRLQVAVLSWSTGTNLPLIFSSPYAGELSLFVFFFKILYFSYMQCYFPKVKWILCSVQIKMYVQFSADMVWLLHFFSAE
jgi:hypothetical protein